MFRISRSARRVFGCGRANANTIFLVIVVIVIIVDRNHKT